jgi:hypothetical protein
MNTSPTPHNLTIWLLAAILGVVLTLAPATASADLDQSPATLDSLTPLEADADAAPGMSVFSASQCGSGYFCVWSQTDYQGTIKRFSTQSQYMSISMPFIGSFYNNRSTRVYIYGDPSGSPSACFGARAKRSSFSNWMNYAKGTYLSTATSC